MNTRKGMFGIIGAVVVAAGLMIAPAPASAAKLPKIECKYSGGVTTCNVVALGGYCGSSRRVGVGITTGKRGGILIQDGGSGALQWKAGKVKDHVLPVGTTYFAVTTLYGKATSAEKPYVSCSL
ncbi:MULTISPECIES: hypothetical protein [unclassified Curtobacterium]|uniref:hypothetical protein n=1 Tax=unclassified Curtobacterium TaxID=257496 RepID=UPI0025B28AAE|nr:hypothetical protein [Curtobacterium sp. 458]WJY01147.1 hypothetical protein QPJ90_05475 [Curtobacterium sp. 458]